jgi:hypothetical protein
VAVVGGSSSTAPSASLAALTAGVVLSCLQMKMLLGFVILVILLVIIIPIAVWAKRVSDAAKNK